MLQIMSPLSGCCCSWLRHNALVEAQLLMMQRLSNRLQAHLNGQPDKSVADDKEWQDVLSLWREVRCSGFALNVAGVMPFPLQDLLFQHLSYYQDTLDNNMKYLTRTGIQTFFARQCATIHAIATSQQLVGCCRDQKQLIGLQTGF